MTCATQQQRGSWARTFRYRKLAACWGHTQANTTYRYVNANVETAKRAAAALDAFNTETLETVDTPELVH
jgi:hypothetical protein